MISVCFQGKPFNITEIQVYAPTTDAEEAKLAGTVKTYHNSRTNTKKDALFIIASWNAKVESQVIPRITGKFGLGVQNETGQRLTELSQENMLIMANILFQQPKRQPYTCTVNTKVRLIMFFAAKGEEVL